MTERRLDINIQPFTIAVAQRTLDDVRERLARTRWPDEIQGAGWDYGTNLEYLKALVTYWHQQFDWRVQEAKLNQFTLELTRFWGYSNVEVESLKFIKRDEVSSLFL